MLRPLPRLGEGHPGAGQCRSAPPRHHQLLRRGRGRHARSHHRAAARRGAAAEERAGCAWPCDRRSRATHFSIPAVVARLGTLELKARTIVEGFLTGLHRSPFKGFSVEFAEYRQYLPGDDLATLDWKVYARTDRHYVKKFEEETNLDCHILLDVSASMGYGSGAVTKLEYGSLSGRGASPT